MVFSFTPRSRSVGSTGSGVVCALSFVLFSAKHRKYALKPPGVSFPGLLSHPVGMITSDLPTLKARRKTLRLEVAYF